MSTVNGPGSSTDNAISRWDGTGGTDIQNSGVIIDDSNNVTGMNTLQLPFDGLYLRTPNTLNNLIIKNGSNFFTSRTLSFSLSDRDTDIAMFGDFECHGGNFRGTSRGTNTGDQTTSGTTDRITVTDGSTNPVIDIASSYEGQTSITTLGTITTGEWQGDVIGSSYGGAGNVSGLLKADGAGNVSAALAGVDYAVSSVVPYTNVLCPHKNLVLKTAGGDSIAFTADMLVLYDAGGDARQFTSFNVTPDITTSGAGGLDTGSPAAAHWYYIWAIAKADGTKSAVFSLSSTAPTLPSGYVYYGLVGADYYNAGSSLLSFLQRGTEVLSAVVPLAYVPSVTGYVSIDITEWVPPIATRIYLSVKPAAGEITTIVPETAIATSEMVISGPDNFVMNLGNPSYIYYTTSNVSVTNIAWNGWSFL